MNLHNFLSFDIIQVIIRYNKLCSDEGSGREMVFHPPKRLIFQVAIL